MIPGVYEFRWEPGHVIFLGAFAAVVLIVAGTLALAVLRAREDLRTGRIDAMRWARAFRDLPPLARSCRHALAGTAPGRICPNGFDCARCAAHAQLADAGGPAPGAASAEPGVPGFDMPLDLWYHRGHAWARPEEDGTVTVGLDDFAARLLGAPGRVELPPPGRRVRVNGEACRMRVRGADVRILCPVEGEVVAAGDPAGGWLLRIRPEGGGFDGRHLLHGPEVLAWMAGEMDRLQRATERAHGGPCLADGGLPVADLAAALPDGERDAILGAILLDP